VHSIFYGNAADLAAGVVSGATTCLEDAIGVARLCIAGPTRTRKREQRKREADFAVIVASPLGGTRKPLFLLLVFWNMYVCNFPVFSVVLDNCKEPSG